MRIKVLLVILILGLIGRIFGQRDLRNLTFTTFPRTDSIIKEDSMNLAILIVDFATYQFKYGSISYYTKCNDNCDVDSLPFLMYFDSWWDVAHVYFHYKFDSSLLFKASIIWMGTGQIEYPTNFITYENFPYVNNSVPLPEDAEYYNTTIAGNYCSWAEYIERANSAWHSIDSLELTNIFASKPFRVGLYGYSRTEGPFNPYRAEWIIFLYRGNTEPVSSGNTSVPKPIKLYPNPTSSNLTIETPGQGFITILNLDGRQLLQQKITETTTSIDTSILPNGIYFVIFVSADRVQVGKVVKQ